MPQDTESRSLDKVIVRLPDGMRDRLKEAAADNKRSMNAEIVERLDRSFYESTERNFLEALASGDFVEPLPPGLAARIQSAAEARHRTVQEEVVQALEEAFPPPPAFTYDEFFDVWMDRIAEAPLDARPPLVEEANRVLQENGDKYEVWLETRDDGRSTVNFGTKGARLRDLKRHSANK